MRLDICKLIDPRAPKLAASPVMAVADQNQPDFERLELLFSSELTEWRADLQCETLMRKFRDDRGDPGSTGAFDLIGTVPCRKTVWRTRLQCAVKPSIPPDSAADFVQFLYTDAIEIPDHCPSSIDAFIRFLEACWRFKLYRLIWLEIAGHIRCLSLLDLMKIGTLLDDHQLPLIDDPEAAIVNYVCVEMLRVNKTQQTMADLALLPNLAALGKRLDPLIDPRFNYPTCELPLVPPRLAAIQLNFFFPDRCLNCLDAQG
jgi:hypothetical protein